VEDLLEATEEEKRQNNEKAGFGTADEGSIHKKKRKRNVESRDAWT
jgi:hypothetical protein